MLDRNGRYYSTGTAVLKTPEWGPNLDRNTHLLEELLSICCTSNPLLQSVVLPNPASCQNQSPRLQANHLAESSRRGILPKTHSCSVLCLATICSPSFLIIRGWTGNAEYFRVRIPDTQFFIDHQCFRLFLRKHNFILIYLHSKGTVLFQDRRSHFHPAMV